VNGILAPINSNFYVAEFEARQELALIVEIWP
jgi:hypothetical protein